MPTLTQHILAPAPGTTSRLAGLFLWQLDDQSRRLTEDTRGATPEELGWQQALGMNTIGMVLAHIAMVEIGWVEAGIRDRAWACDEVLQMNYKECGVPLAADGVPPPGLHGRELAFFDDLLARARAHTRAVVAPLTDANLERRFTQRKGTDREFEGNVGWTLYHILEHEAGHYGQINLLRHHY
ncbi:MAG: DinB family protein, partial [Candidatus Eisenbacteria bacterium]